MLILLVTASAGGVVSFATAGSGSSAKHPPRARATAIPGPTPIPGVFPGPLDGLPTAKGNALRRPIAVLIDNFEPDARPQSGLAAASVVFEALVEGGVTRVMPIYLERGASSVGPIRSARPYFVDWAAGYRALFVHDGGSPAALRLLAKTPQLADIDAGSGDPAFFRTQDREPPHNLYAGTASIRSSSLRIGYNRRMKFTWMLHKQVAPQAARGTIQSIHIDFSIPSVLSPGAYAVDYKYDPSTSEYLRSVGDAPAVDAATGRQIMAANVVVLTATARVIPKHPQQRLDMQSLGTGPAFVFRDGQVIRGRWTKKSAADAIVVRDARGHAVAFDPGTTWIEVVPPGGVKFGTR